MSLFQQGVMAGLFSFLLFSVEDGVGALIWSYAFYLTSAIIFLLFIPITIMRCMQGIINLHAKTFTSVEIGVWVLRISQYLLMVRKGNQIPVQKMAHSNTWHYLLHRLNNLSWNQWIWDIAIYCLIFGLLNLTILMSMKI